MTKKQHKKIKIIKKFSELERIKKKDLFFKSIDSEKLKLKSLDKKYIVSIARQLADGFDTIDLRKNINNSDYKRAQKVIKNYFKTLGGDYKTIRPRKNNRKIYAQASGLPANFKIYTVPVSADDASFKIVKRKGKKQLIVKSKYTNEYKLFFPDKKRLAKNPVKETEKLVKLAPKPTKTKKRDIKIIVGRHTTKAIYEDNEQLFNEIEYFFNAYDNALDFVFGIQVTTFSNQQELTRHAKKKRKKKIRNRRL